MASAGNMLDKEVTRNLDMDTSAVTGLAIGINRTAVPNGLQCLNRRYNNRPICLAITRRNKTNTARIMLHLRGVNTGITKQSFVLCTAG